MHEVEVRPRLVSEWQDVTLRFHEGCIIKDLVCSTKELIFIHKNDKIIAVVVEKHWMNFLQNGSCCKRVNKTGGRLVNLALLD